MSNAMPSSPAIQNAASTPKKDRDFVTALARGLEILRCFTAQRTELGTTDIARLTGLAQSTVWRLCHTLLELGYLTPASHPDRLRVGINVLALGGTSITQAGIANAAYPYMMKIANQFNASLSLAGRADTKMIIIQRAEAPGMLRLNFSVGRMLSMRRSAVGAAYLAATSEEERADLMEKLRRLAPDSWPQTRKYLDEAKAMYQEHGYVLNLQRYHPDISAVAVPLVSPDGRTIMAVNCGGPSSTMTVERLTGPIAQAMFELAATLKACYAL
jgi:DNA-binding IclR family transcriptional regulator